MIYIIVPGSCNRYQKTNKTFITTRYQNTNYFIRGQLASPPMTLRIIWIRICANANLVNFCRWP